MKLFIFFYIVSSLLPLGIVLYFIFSLLSLFLRKYVNGLMCQKNAAIGGALTGALLSLGDGKYTTDKMVQHAITGGALATASEFVRNLI